MIARKSQGRPQAPFAARAVETKNERGKVMFQVSVQIDPNRSRAHALLVRSGLPGVAYLRADPAVVWPKDLQGTS